jgi:hypothetical protein
MTQSYSHSILGINGATYAKRKRSARGKAYLIKRYGLRHAPFDGRLALVLDAGKSWRTGVGLAPVAAEEGAEIAAAYQGTIGVSGRGERRAGSVRIAGVRAKSIARVAHGHAEGLLIVARLAKIIVRANFSVAIRGSIEDGVSIEGLFLVDLGRWAILWDRRVLGPRHVNAEVSKSGADGEIFTVGIGAVDGIIEIIVLAVGASNPCLALALRAAAPLEAEAKQR